MNRNKSGWSQRRCLSRILGKIVFCGVVLIRGTMSLADSALPYNTDLLASLNSFDVQTDQWTLMKGVLSKKTPIYHGDPLLIVKEGVVKTPVWYILQCDLVNIEKQNGTLPAAGIVFGYLDKRNFWSLVIDGTTQTAVKLAHVKDAKTVSETCVPFTMRFEQKEVRISLEIHHPSLIKVRVNESLAMICKSAGEIQQGRLGLSLQTGMCGFSNFRITGVAKK